MTVFHLTREVRLANIIFTEETVFTHQALSGVRRTNRAISYLTRDLCYANIIADAETVCTHQAFIVVLTNSAIIRAGSTNSTVQIKSI